jgi:isoleucyl-tRNA synthetase
VLTTFNGLIAPIMPFMAETVYQNLVAKQRSDSPASIHHVPFPQADARLIDETLSAHVAATLRLVSLARSARKESNLKIRQPLAELVVVPGSDAERNAVPLFEDHFVEELNVKKVTLREDRDGLYTVTVSPNMKTLGPKFGRHLPAARKVIGELNGADLEARLARGESVNLPVEGTDAVVGKEDLTISKSYGEHWAGVADGATVVLIDKRITPTLKNEGIARDIVRNVQNLRKDAGLDIADRIKLSLVTESAMLKAAIDQFHDYIAGETLAAEIVSRPLDGAVHVAELEVETKHKVSITLARSR